MFLNYDVEQLKHILKSFYELTQIRIVMFDDQLNKIAEVPDQDCAFCNLIRTDEDAKRECLRSDRYACIKCREGNTPHSYICHSGLTETVVPISHGNIIIGYLMFGQVLNTSDQQVYWSEVKDRCSKYNLDTDELYSVYCNKKPVNMNKVYASANILEACAGYLWLQRYISLKEDTLPRQIDEYLTNNLNSDLKVQTLCRKFNVSRSKLYKVVQEYYGCGIEQLTRGLRVKKARELLETTDLPVSEVAYSVGYLDCNYFIKVFKKAVGETPARYRKCHESAAEANMLS